jgi:2-hydroxycyclohexanecarboxyl-CoA dehydrogenase
LQFDGKTVIVTGAGQGIGRAIALVFAERGANLVINGRTAPKLDAVTAELQATGAHVVSVVGDVSQRADVAATVEAAVAAFGRIDVLVNNAQSSVSSNTPVLDIDDDNFVPVFGSGALGTLYMMQACHPVMREGGGGSIVNMGSSTAITGDPGFGSYVMTKEAIRGISRVAAREWGRYNIRVNVICPAALTDSAVDFSERHPEAYARMLKTVPLGRIGDPVSDIAGAVAALAGLDLQYLTGATLMLDGGRLLFP